MSLDFHGATITMPYPDFTAVQAELRKLRTAVQEAQQAAPVLAIPLDAVHHALNAAVTVAQFAVAELPAETHRGWPVDALRILGEYLIRAGKEDLGLTFVHESEHTAKIDDFRGRRLASAEAVLAMSEE